MHDFGINMEKLNLMKEFLSVQGRKLLITDFYLYYYYYWYVYKIMINFT